MFPASVQFGLEFQRFAFINMAHSVTNSVPHLVYFWRGSLQIE